MSLPSVLFDENCAFCKIVQDDDGGRVFEDEHTIAFLDHRPLFPGHCLLIPKSHLETIDNLSDYLIGPFFANVRMLSRAVKLPIQAKETFLRATTRTTPCLP